MTTTGGLTIGTLGTFGLSIAGGWAFGPIGFAVGALAGAFLFGSSGPKVEGPRLGDLSVSSSTYGGVIPVCFGVQKVAGTMIWATDIDEDKHTRKVGGGLFGGGQKIVEYRYFANFTVAFGEGPAGGVLRIFAGERLIADLRPGAGAATHNTGKYNFRTYLGTDSQEPDPLVRRQVEATHGAGAVPAHRDLVYIVFENFPLDEFGNRIPPISAEISWAGAPQAVVNDATKLSPVGHFLDTLGLDPARGYLYYKTDLDEIGRIRVAGMVEDARVSETDLGIALEDIEAVDADGNIYVTHGVTEQSFRKIDRDTLQVVASASFSSNVELATIHGYDLTDRVDLVLALGFLSAPAAIFRARDLQKIWQGPNVSSRPGGLVGGVSEFGACEAWFAAYPSIVLGQPTATVNLLHARVEMPVRINPLTGEATNDVTSQLITLAAGELGAGTMTATQLCYDEQNDRLLFISVLDGVRHLVSYSAADGIVWYVPVAGDLPHQGRFTDGKIRMVNGTSVILHSADDGSLISSQGGFTGTSGVIRFDPRTGALYTPTQSSGIEQWLPGRTSSDSSGLDEVVTALCARVGIGAGDLDVTELGTDEVRGFGISRQVSVRGALELLTAAYAFDLIESDHKLKAKKRGQPVTRALSEDDLVRISEQETFVETRAQEVDLPVRFSVRYQDQALDGEIATQTGQRIRSPDPTMGSENEATLDLPMTLSAAEAMDVVLRQLYSAWLERTGHEWKASWAHVDLEPADVIQVALNDGGLFTVRLLSCDLGANLEVAWQSVVEESSSYTVQAVPAGGLNYLPQFDPVSSEARLFLLDIPLLRDLDDVQRVATGHYWAAAAYFDPPWRGAVLFASDDGAIYAGADETFDPVTWGVARNALPDTDLPFQTDATSEMQVALTSGQLSSVTSLELLNGANVAALVRADGNVELIQFQEAVLSQGIYTLTTLLRGRRGTEVFTGGHAVGDLFVLLEGDGVTRRPLGLDRLGDTLHFRAVGRGGELRDARTEQLTLAGNDLKPYAPVHLAASGSFGADIALSWVRRTRVGGDLIDGSGEVPLAEDSEEYELQILAGPGGAVLRTETGITTTSFTYTSGMQAADFWGAQTELTFRVYQISAQDGRGFASEATVEILP